VPRIPQFGLVAGLSVEWFIAWRCALGNLIGNVSPRLYVDALGGRSDRATPSKCWMVESWWM